MTTLKTKEEIIKDIDELFPYAWLEWGKKVDIPKNEFIQVKDFFLSQLTNKCYHYYLNNKYMKQKILISLSILTVIYTLIWWHTFKYHECIKVGHSKIYCILS